MSDTPALLSPAEQARLVDGLLANADRLTVDVAANLATAITAVKAAAVHGIDRVATSTNDVLSYRIKQALGVDDYGGSYIKDAVKSALGSAFKDGGGNSYVKQAFDQIVAAARAAIAPKAE